jgi:hypothetical protein
LEENDLALRRKVIQVTQSNAVPPAPPPLPTYPREFCGVTDLGNQCSSLQFTNGFELGLCGS